MKLKIYEYKNCEECKKALQYFDGKKIYYDVISIIDTPPSLSECKKGVNLDALVKAKEALWPVNFFMY